MITRADFKNFNDRFEYRLPGGFDCAVGRFPFRAAATESAAGCERARQHWRKRHDG